MFCGSISHAFSCKHETHDLLTLVSYQTHLIHRHQLIALRQQLICDLQGRVHGGLGYLIIYGSQVFRLDWVMMSIVLLCMIAMLLYGLLGLIEKRCLRRR